MSLLATNAILHFILSYFILSYLILYYLSYSALVVPKIVMADMTDTHDLKRFDFLDYMAQTTEYSFLSDRRKNSDQSETEETIKRFFTAEYISDFVEKVLRGTFLSIVRSESEEEENMPLEEVAVGVEVEVQEGEIDLVSGHSTSTSTSASPSAKNPSTPVKKIEGQTQGQAEGQGTVEGPVVRVVGSNFNAR